MVARAPKEPLTLETIVVDPPKRGEVRVKVVYNVQNSSNASKMLILNSWKVFMEFILFVCY